MIWFEGEKIPIKTKRFEICHSQSLIWFDAINSFSNQFRKWKTAIVKRVVIFFFDMGSFNYVYSPNLAYKLWFGEWFDKRFEIYPNHPVILHSQIIINSWLHVSDCQAKISILLIWEKSGIFNSSVIWYPSLILTFSLCISPLSLLECHLHVFCAECLGEDGDL